jgi:hypothetical protein
MMAMAAGRSGSGPRESPNGSTAVIGLVLVEGEALNYDFPYAPTIDV